ncbi:MAG: hypothetical protein U0326_03315 [Polyangiales bacterium]
MSGEKTIAFREAAVAEAMKVWTVGANEKNKSSTRPIAEDSGFDHTIFKKDGTTWAWCGMFVAAMLYRAGLCPALRSGMWETRNVVHFFAYDYEKRVPRWVWDGDVGGWLELKTLHQASDSMRTWIDRESMQDTALGALDILPGDVALIDHEGDGKPDHITLVESYDPATGLLMTIEGNGYGRVAKLEDDGTVTLGDKEADAVVRNPRDLSDSKQRRRIFGVGRLSAVDFEQRAYANSDRCPSGAPKGG